MNKTTVCNRQQLLSKLEELNFRGPVKIAGNEFMLYHGQALAVPSNQELSTPQIRIILREVDDIVSQEEWQN